jgi:hypothetical protein
MSAFAALNLKTGLSRPSNDAAESRASEKLAIHSYVVACSSGEDVRRNTSYNLEKAHMFEAGPATYRI